MSLENNRIKNYDHNLDIWETKYLKYKNKYLEIKQKGGEEKNNSQSSCKYYYYFCFNKKVVDYLFEQIKIIDTITKNDVDEILKVNAFENSPTGISLVKYTKNPNQQLKIKEGFPMNLLVDRKLDYPESLDNLKKIIDTLNTELSKSTLNKVGGSEPTDAAPTDAAPTDAAPTDAAPTDAAPTDAAENKDTEEKISYILIFSTKNKNFELVYYYNYDNNGELVQQIKREPINITKIIPYTKVKKLPPKKFLGIF
jgi:hypothetical protein